MDKLNIKEKKVSILKYYLACFHYMLEKACTYDIIIQGLSDVVMLDEKHKLWPDFYAIKKTKRRSITISEMQMIEKHFLNCSKSC